MKKAAIQELSRAAPAELKHTIRFTNHLSSLPIVATGALASVLLASNINGSLVYWALLLILLASAAFMKASQIIILALALLVYLPTEYISKDPLQTFFNPTTFLVILFLFKVKARPSRTGFYVLILGVAFLGVFSALSINSTRSVVWSIQLVLLLYCLLSVRKIKATSSGYLLGGLSMITISLGILAISEYLLSTTLLYNGSFLPSYEDAYKWENYSVFRVSSTLGHPLNNGLFFSTAASILLLNLAQGARNVAYSAAILFSFVGVFLSGSRSAILSLGIATLLILITSWKRVSPAAKVWLSLSTPIAAIFAGESPWFRSIFVRIESVEGASSQTYRQDLLQWVDFFADKYPFQGSGPGTSGYAWAAFGNTAPLENGFLQLWVSLGLFSALVLIVALITVFFRMIKRNDSSWIQFITVLVYIPLTNFVDDSSSFMAFICVVSLLAFANRRLAVNEDL